MLHEALAHHARDLVAPIDEPRVQIGVPFQVVAVLLQEEHLLLLLHLHLEQLLLLQLSVDLHCLLLSEALQSTLKLTCLGQLERSDSGLLLL